MNRNVIENIYKSFIFYLREGFKKSVTNVRPRGGGPADQMLDFLKLCWSVMIMHSLYVNI